jgi:hypothetical protein
MDDMCARSCGPAIQSGNPESAICALSALGRTTVHRHDRAHSRISRPDWRWAAVRGYRLVTIGGTAASALAG